MADNRDKPLADRRAEAAGEGADDAQETYEVPDIGGEHQPSPTDPPGAPEEAPGGEAEGYQPQTRTP